jgi:FAD:protein FMN transferase
MKQNKYKVFILVATLILSIILISCKKEEKNDNLPISKTGFLMDTVMTVKIYDNGNEELIEKIFNRIEEIEEKMSVTIESSDVNMINKNAGVKPVEVDNETYQVLQKSIEYAQMSNGHYDPTVGPLVEIWDIKSGETVRDNIPTIDEIEENKKLVDYKKLQLLDNNQVYLKEKEMNINLGSIVKGYAADEVKKILSQNGVKGAIIDLGGNVFAYGNKEEDPWKIGVQDPREATGIKLGILKIDDKSIVSSGNYERYFMYNNTRYHHILNPKTGYPAENELMGVTIVSNKSIDGDALSTTMFVLGLEKGKNMAETLDGIQVIFITKDNQIHVPEEFVKNEMLTGLNKNYEIIVY